jgi:coatomer protein complex subunit alpha (xenin)
MNVAYDLGDDAWRQLGVEALRQGNHEVVEMSYQKTKEFDALSFLYLLTGNTEKLRKMQKIAEMRGDAMSCVHNALYLGDAEERVKIIEMTGQLALAYLTARTHGLHETADRLLELLHSSGIAVPEVDPNATLLLPPTPIYRSENWPQLAVGKSAVAAGAEGGGGISSMAMDGDEFHDAQGGGSWGDDDDLFDDEGGAEKKAAATESKGGKAASGWGDDDLEISDDEAPAPSSPSKGSVETSRNADGSIFTVPNAGNPPTIAWCAESSHCADHFAAGSADSAVQLLNRQVAATNVAPLKAGATSLFVGASAFLPGFPLAPSNRSYLVRDTGKPAPGTAPKTFPALTLKVTALLEQLKQAYRAFTNAQLAECQASLEDILHSILLISVTARTESNDLKELLDVSREYLIALRVKKAMDGVAAEDVGRGLELAAYFTHCNLQPSHLVLALKTAMASAFKNKVRIIYAFSVRFTVQIN